MTLLEMNKIENVLKENKKVKQNAAVMFRDTMRKKYCEDGDCWFETRMNDEEKKIYELTEQESREALEIYSSFVNHNWQ